MKKILCNIYQKYYPKINIYIYIKYIKNIDELEESLQKLNAFKITKKYMLFKRS